MSRATASRPLHADYLLAKAAAGVLHLSLEETARVLKISEGQARALAARDELPVRCFRMGRTYRVSIDGLLELFGLTERAEASLRARQEKP